jgi:SSS family solute:Na+ symporter
MGMWSSIAILILSILLAGYIRKLQGSLFVYIQTLYAFFAPPFLAVFLLGILSRLINAQGTTTTVIFGFIAGILMKIYVQFSVHPVLLEPYSMQSIINWGCLYGDLSGGQPHDSGTNA